MRDCYPVWRVTACRMNQHEHRQEGGQHEAPLPWVTVWRVTVLSMNGGRRAGVGAV